MVRTVEGIVKQAVQDTFNRPTITRQTIINANNAMIRKSPRKIRRLNVTRVSQQLGVTIGSNTQQTFSTLANQRLGVMTQRPQQHPTTTPQQATPIQNNVQDAPVEKFMPFWKKVRRFFGIK
jgi:hypothetical protein